ncbi:MAG: S-layer homology domain-containing protein, partial [Oscillospiraceae bacterium]
YLTEKGLKYDEYVKKSEKVNRALIGDEKADLQSTINTINALSNNGSGGSGGSGGSSGSGGSGGSGGNGGNGIAPPTVNTGNNTNEPLAPVDAFNDLDSVLWAKASINELYKRGVINGKEANKFFPNDLITREEFTKILVIAFGIEEAVAPLSFSDVKPDSWSYTYIASAAKAGIVKGDGNAFNPETNITREDMAVMIGRAIMKYGKIPEFSSYDVNFSDKNDISDYAIASVSLMEHENIISGDENNNFMPLAEATRAESAKMIYEAMKYSA